MSEAYILLIIILALGLLAKNTSVIIAVAVLLGLKLLRVKSLLTFLDEKGIEIGLIIMMTALMAPIATGEFGIGQFGKFLKEPIGIVAVLIGVAVTIFARQGVQLMSSNPVIVPMAIAGIIIGVVIFKGVPVGPLVASGLTAALWGLVKFFFR